MTTDDAIQDLLDSQIFIRPELEEACVSPWRAFAVDAAPRPLAFSGVMLGALGPGLAIEADEDTGRVRIFNDSYELEVIGHPGEEVIVPGIEPHTDVDYWLRKVHARYWEFGPALERTLHEKTDALAAGTEPLPEPGQPRLYAPDFRVPAPEWVVPSTTLHHNLVEQLGTDDSRFFEVFEVDSEGAHTLVGSFILTHNGEVMALLYEKDRPDGLTREATRALAQLGAAKFANDIMHNHLHTIVTGVILGVDNEMVARTGWR